MRLRYLFMMVILLTGFSAPVYAIELTQEQKEAIADKVNAAIDSAKEWVAVVDQEHYSESWDRAAKFFQERVPDSQWETTMDQVRNPLGKVVSREVSNYQYLTHMPGAPAGEYVIIQFKTSFDKKSDGAETITSMIEDDGQWRVSNYQVK